MNAWGHTAAARVAREDHAAAFDLARAPSAAAPGPLVFACPHAGRVYPPSLMAASRLDALAIRRSEDAHVDRLIAAGPDHGASMITARLARAWFDLNRAPWELDPAMFEDELPAYARGRSTRVAAGLGAIARVVGDGEEIYRRKLTFAEAAERVEAVHKPYHEALAGLVSVARRRCGVAVLIDWHSMPSAAARQAGPRGCDVALGDRYGTACAPALTRMVERAFQDLGYGVTRNTPYAGGYTTEHYGAPGRRIHALQVEINRAIYMDEASLAPTAGFARLRADLTAVFAVLAAADWTKL